MGFIKIMKNISHLIQFQNRFHRPYEELFSSHTKSKSASSTL
ncbi:hypothetical protein J2S19_003355 [Metabacillus malikii]|uniref:Uncharacterized protein n=1 Tax=Metabacillus malikii TaxID=1504265 RepID=A0ABT9ZLH8_9BACI|nr:hypothetical protein [Metabacillus malikii]